MAPEQSHLSAGTTGCGVTANGVVLQNQVPREQSDAAAYVAEDRRR